MTEEESAIHGFPGAAELGMTDGERIERAIAALATTADARDWTGLRALFADEVDLDYTSVAGGTPARLPADAIVAGWRDGLGRYQATKHNFSDVRTTFVDGAATATFTGQATHVKANGERWSCGGDYVFRFARTGQGWKIAAATFSMTWEQGVR